MRNEWLEWKLNRLSVYGVLFILACLVRLACFTGLVASDDIYYSYYGQLLSHGSYNLDFSSHFGSRIGVNVLVGLGYWMFGVSELTTILFPLLLSSLSVVLIVEIGSIIFSKRAGLLAGVLLLTFPVHVHIATMLLPESIMDFWILMGVLAYLIGLKQDQWQAGVFSGLFFGIAYLSKESGFFASSGFVLCCLIFQKNWKLAFAIVSSLAFVGVAELSCYYLLTGDPMYRVHVVVSSQEAYFAASSTNEDIYWRLFKDYPYRMLVPNSNFGLHSIAVLLLSAAAAFVLPRRTFWMLFLWAAIPMLYLNFSSVSLTKYLPAPVQPRYITQVFLPLILLAAAVIDGWMLSGSRRLLIGTCGVFSIVVVVGVVSAFSMRGEGGGNVPAVYSLRGIVSQLESSHRQVVKFEGKKADIWRFTMGILTGPEPHSGECVNDCLLVRPDASGLPSVADMPPTDVKPVQQPSLFYLKEAP